VFNVVQSGAIQMNFKQCYVSGKGEADGRNKDFSFCFQTKILQDAPKDLNTPATGHRANITVTNLGHLLHCFSDKLPSGLRNHCLHSKKKVLFIEACLP
jgi:hypothetical protein